MESDSNFSFLVRDNDIRSFFSGMSYKIDSNCLYYTPAFCFNSIVMLNPQLKNKIPSDSNQDIVTHVLSLLFHLPYLTGSCAP